MASLSASTAPEPSTDEEVLAEAVANTTLEDAPASGGGKKKKPKVVSTMNISKEIYEALQADLVEKDQRIADLQAQLAEKDARINQLQQADATPQRASPKKSALYTKEQYEEVSKILFEEPLLFASCDVEQHGYKFRVFRDGRVAELKIINGKENEIELEFPTTEKWTITRGTGSNRHTFTITNLIVQAFYPAFKEVRGTPAKYDVMAKKIEFKEEKSPQNGKFSVENIFMRPTDTLMKKFYKDQQAKQAEEINAVSLVTEAEENQAEEQT